MKIKPKTIKIILGILIILSPYIYSLNETLGGVTFISPMREVFYISKIICTIAGIYIINKEI